MKIMPCLVFLSPLVGLGLLAFASTLGLKFPFAFVAAHLVGFSCAAGALVMLMKDYAPRPRHSLRGALSTASAQPTKVSVYRMVIRSRPEVRPTTTRSRPFARPINPALGFRNDPATLTLS